MGPRYANSPRTSRNTRNADHEDQRSTIKNILGNSKPLWMITWMDMVSSRDRPRDQDCKGTGKGTGKINRKPNRKSDKPTRGKSGGGGGGDDSSVDTHDKGCLRCGELGGGGDDSSVDTHDKGCLRCGERHAIRDCPHSAEDSGKAAETDSGSESDDDDLDDEDEKDIQIALISIQMRKSMKTGGFSKKAIERKIKKFEEGMYTK